MSQFFFLDCMEYIEQVSDKQFDLAIVDPQYGINVSCYRDKFETKLTAAKKYNMSVYSQKKPDKHYFNELRRVSKNQIIWGGNYFADMLPASRGWIVWNKKTSGVFADAELAWTSFDQSVRIFDFAWNGMIQGYGGNKRKNEVRIHPCQKPVALYRWILNHYAKPGDKILDTHAGSGSSIIAFTEEGYEYTAFEIVEEYYDDTYKRVQEYKEQMRLF